MLDAILIARMIQNYPHAQRQEISQCVFYGVEKRMEVDLAKRFNFCTRLKTSNIKENKRAYKRDRDNSRNED